MKIEIISFGHKYGDIQADTVFDVRCLVNPYWEAELRPLCGLDAPICNYIFADRDSADFLHRMAELTALQVRMAEAKGCESLRIAVGCTGGRHRSVAAAAYLAQTLGRPCTLTHRDLSREG